jgi:hypothetical protein
MKIPTVLSEQIKFVKKALEKPYHLFFYTNAGRAIFRIEDKRGDFLFWEGSHLAAAVESAIEYVKHEIEQGAAKDPTIKKQTKK